MAKKENEIRRSNGFPLEQIVRQLESGNVPLEEP